MIIAFEVILLVFNTLHYSFCLQSGGNNSENVEQHPISTGINVCNQGIPLGGVTQVKWQSRNL